jgi:hypothetical protein
MKVYILLVHTKELLREDALDKFYHPATTKVEEVFTSRKKAERAQRAWSQAWEDVKSFSAHIGQPETSLRWAEVVTHDTTNEFWSRERN